LLLAEGGAKVGVTGSRGGRGAGGNPVISIPVVFKRRGGRREIILPADAHDGEASTNKAFLITLARAFRWKDLLESGRFGSVKELAAAVGLERSYVAKLLNLTLLAPRIVEAVVAGDEPGGMSVAELRQGVTARWDDPRWSQN